MAETLAQKKLLNKRLLICRRYGSAEYPDEVTLVEISPSGERVKLQWTAAATWCDADKYRLLEILPDASPTNETEK